MGRETAAISPSGSSEEVPGGTKEFMEVIRRGSGAPGESIRFNARLHEGSHDACDVALEG
jgi:hypothetical protein